MIYFDIKKYQDGFFINYVSDNFFTKTEQTCKEYFAKFNVNKEEVNNYFKGSLEGRIIDKDLAKKLLPGCLEYAKEEIDIKLDKIFEGEIESCSKVERKSREIQAKEFVKTLAEDYDSAHLAKIARFKEIEVTALTNSISSKAKAEEDKVIHLKACAIYLKNLVSKFTNLDQYIDLDLDKEINNFDKIANNDANSTKSFPSIIQNREEIIVDKDTKIDLPDHDVSDSTRRFKNPKITQKSK